MVIRRVSFIEAGSPGLHIFSKFPIPRLGAVLLSTILSERGLEDIISCIRTVKDHGIHINGSQDYRAAPYF
jgi:hypothetical protein